MLYASRRRYNRGSGVVSSNTITPSIATSVSSGTAPFVVVFDATGTTSSLTSLPFHEIKHSWDFGESAGPGVGTWGAGARSGVNSRNVGKGPIAGHVFETPGNFTVTYTAFDGTNTATATVGITVADPNTVYSGTNTICISTSGTFTSAPSGCAQVTTSSFATAMANAAVGKRVLFRGGETWTATAQGNVNANNSTGGQIGQFGTGNAIIQRSAAYTAQEATLSLSRYDTPNMKNWTVYGLTFDHSLIAIDSHYGLGLDAGIDNVLALRITGKATGRVVQAPPSFINFWNQNGHAGHHIWSGFGVVDCATNSIPIGSAAPATNTWPYGIFAAGEFFFFAGNNFDLGGSTGEGTSHTGRFSYVGKGAISNNTMAGAGQGEHCIKLHGPDSNTPTDVAAELAGIGGGATRWVVVSDNQIVPSYGGQPVSLGPESDSVAEIVKDVIFERNWVRFTQVPPGSTQCVLMHGPYQTSRNNLVNASGTPLVAGITCEQRGTSPAPVPTNCAVYNNTIYKSDTASNFTGVLIGSGVTTTVVKNNLGYAPADSQHIMVTDTGTGTTVGNNSSTAQVNGTDPKFSGALTAVAGWQITDATSYTKNAGAAVPVWDDFFGTARPTGASMDIGASEQ